MVAEAKRQRCAEILEQMPLGELFSLRDHLSELSGYAAARVMLGREGMAELAEIVKQEINERGTK